MSLCVSLCMRQQLQRVREPLAAHVARVLRPRTARTVAVPLVAVRSGDMSPEQVCPLEGDAAVLAEELGPPHRVVHGALAPAVRQRRQTELHVVTGVGVFEGLFLLFSPRR